MLVVTRYLPATAGKQKEKIGGMKMSNFKEVSTKVERYAIIVSVPMSVRLITIKGQDIYEVEEAFRRKRDSANDSSRKIEFDRVRALLKYASTCGAQLDEIYNAHKKLVLSLCFFSLEDLTQFNKTMAFEVDKATMR